MFALAKYRDRLFEMKWIFAESRQTEMEEVLQVEFAQDGEYFKITAVDYTYFDVLAGLEELDFALVKRGDECILRVLGDNTMCNATLAATVT